MRPLGTVLPGAVHPARSRSWRYVLGLLVLAPFVAETVASANTPAVLFPVLLPLYAVVYGCPALLVRELWIRGRLTVPRLLLLGIAYTAFNEGVVAATWFKLAPATGKVLGFTAYQAGRAGGVNWAVAVNLVTYHTVFSLAVPIVLVQAVALARRSDAAYRPWLHRRGIVISLALIAFVLLGSLTGPATTKACRGPAHAACAAGRGGSAVLILVLGAAVAWLPLAARTVRAARRPARGAGRPALLVGGGFAFAAAFFVSYFALPLNGLPAASVATGAALLVVAGLSAAWLAPGLRWEPRSGVLLCLGLLAPGMLVSVRAWLFGQPLAAALAVALIVRLLRHLPSRRSDPGRRRGYR